jgi:hypothetical protein
MTMKLNCCPAAKTLMLHDEVLTMSLCIVARIWYDDEDA